MSRLRQVQKKIKKPILITSQPNIFYLSGFSGSSGALIITPKRAWFFTDPRYTAVARVQLARGVKLMEIAKGDKDFLNKFLRKEGVRELRFEAQRMTVAEREVWKEKLGRGIRLSEAKFSVDKVRSVKDRSEIKLMKKAGKITADVFKDLKLRIKLGMTEKDIAWEIEKLAREMGADELAFDPIVAFGENTAIPHHQKSDRKLTQGDAIQLDFGVEVEGYKSDMSRVLFAGEPSVEMREIYIHVLEMQKMAIEDVVPGKRCKDLANEYTPETLTEKGDELVSHGLGHGVGLEIHELPNLKPKSKAKLEIGQVVTIEPGYYKEGIGGVRVEDTVLVTRKGQKILTPAPKTIRSAVLYI